MAGTPTRRAPYKDTLQPALHRRFSSTATLLLAVAYLQSLFLADWSSYFWLWFPLGPAGIRTLLVFTCGIAILILRIANYHVGLKTSGSGWQTLRTSLLTFNTYETALWYGLSSLLYSYVYLLNQREETNLRWITYFSGDRARLNERPVFLTCYMFTYALLQTISHFKSDIDRLNLGQPSKKARSQREDNGSLSNTFQAVLMELPVAFLDAGKQSIAALPVTLILYYAFMRSFAWSWTLMFVRPFYNLPKTSMLPPSWPTDIYLIARCLIAGTLVGFLWMSGNTAFSAFMVKKPLKNNNPLTSDSRDPNGSLLNGLKSKKSSIQSFAMWELALISQDFEGRRKAIFNDIDRKDGPMWNQIFSICMETLHNVEFRVDSYGKPVTSVATLPAKIEEKHRSSVPLKEDQIYRPHNGSSALRTGMEKALDRLARNPNSSPASELSPIAKKTWQQAKDKVLTKEQQEAVSPDHLMAEIKGYAMTLLGIDWVGDLFRQSFQAQFAAAVLGTPYAEPTLHSNAVIALSQLAVHSLSEDSYGNVHRDVTNLIRTLTSLIQKIEGLKSQFPIHWTDKKGIKDSPEVDHLVDTMKISLELIINKFEQYSSDLKLTRADIRLAKEAMVKREVVQEAAKTKEEPVRSKQIEKRQEIRETRREPKVVSTRDLQQDTTIDPQALYEERAQRRAARREQQKRVEMEQVR